MAAQTASSSLCSIISQLINIQICHATMANEQPMNYIKGILITWTYVHAVKLLTKITVTF